MTRPKAYTQFLPNTTLRAVQGYFRVNGKIVKRVLYRFDELGWNAQGEPLKPGAREAKRVDNLLKARHAEVFHELQQAAPGPEGPRIQAVMQDWLDFVADRAADSTHALYLDSVNKYLAHVGNHPLRQFTAKHADKFSRALLQAKPRALAPATVNRHLRDLTTFLRWAWKRGELPAVPYVQKVAEPRKIPRTWSPDAILRMMERLHPLARHHPHPRWRRYYLLHERFLWVAMFTGMRRSEIVTLPRAAVDFQAGRIDVLMQGTFRTKERREKRVPLVAELAAYLWDQFAQYPDEVWLLDDGDGKPAYADAHSLTTAFARHYAELDLPAVKLRPKALHGFRATVATQLLNLHGLDLHTAGAWLGHADPKVTLGSYIATHDGKLRKAAEIVDTQPTGLLENSWKVDPDATGKGKRAKRLRPSPPVLRS